jgi:uncharacterized membrane protein YeaQ/YmgE (transglycosylase-associated protein family)
MGVYTEDKNMEFIGSLIASPFICVGWVIVGFLAGAFARRIMGSKNAGCVSDIVLGLIGVFVGGLIATALQWNRPEGGLSGVIVSLVVGVVGACVLIALGRIVRPVRR